MNIHPYKSVVLLYYCKNKLHGCLVHFDMHLLTGVSVRMSVYITHVQCMININTQNFVQIALKACILQPVYLFYHHTCVPSVLYLTIYCSYRCSMISLLKVTVKRLHVLVDQIPVRVDNNCDVPH